MLGFCLLLLEYKLHEGRDLLYCFPMYPQHQEQCQANNSFQMNFNLMLL